jgi:hypothetical protein
MTEETQPNSGSKRLTQKQETFCLKYFELGNAAEAARLAKYSTKTARFIGAENLLKPNIQTRLQELRQSTEDATIAGVKERKQILTEIARANMTNFVEVGQDGAWFNIDETNLNNRAIQSVQSKTVLGKDGADDAVFIRVNLHDPTKAIDLLNKMDKIYSDQPAGNVYNIGAMQVNVGDPKEKLLSELTRLAARTGEGENNTEPTR